MSDERPAERPAAPPLPRKRTEQPQPQGDPGKATRSKPTTSTPFRRYFLPSPTLSLGGETDERAWSIYLTSAQAASGNRLSFTYQNAVVVAPEASKLSVF